jgi:predicted nuclease of restriction endonuclease-like (RecB) superfamily
MNKKIQTTNDNDLNLREYIEFLENLKTKVSASRYKAARLGNNEVILLYHYIGTEILKRQQLHGWGAKIINQVSKDLTSEFPDMKGLSPTNLKYMRRFAKEFPDFEFVQQAAVQLPWFHLVTIMDKVSDRDARIFYIMETIGCGWARSILTVQIETDLYNRQGRAITNFKDKLPCVQSELAQYTLKDPYLFDFLSIGKEAHEREIEKGLIAHMEKFLLELGKGFAYIGKQYHLEVGGQDFYLDLLFYNFRLRAFVVVDLKNTPFKPEYAGKMNFYISAVDSVLKHETDNPTIGLILCKSKNEIVAEYTLQNINSPIGLAEYRVTEALPENIKTELPTIEELEQALNKSIDEE